VRLTGSTPTYSGLIFASRFSKGPSERGQPMRWAMTGAGIRGHDASSARIAGS
jgi:hypothetical protein